MVVDLLSLRIFWPRIWSLVGTALGVFILSVSVLNERFINTFRHPVVLRVWSSVECYLLCVVGRARVRVSNKYTKDKNLV